MTETEVLRAVGSIGAVLFVIGGCLMIFSMLRPL